jgi:AsmA-like C-terminal region
MNWPKRLWIILPILLILAVAGASFIPLDTFVPGFEQALSEQLHEPVSIRHLRVAALPSPHLELMDVHLGGAEGIVASSVLVEPDLPALLEGEVVVRRIMVQDGSADIAQVRKLVELFSNTSGKFSAISLRVLELSGMNLLMPEVTIGPVEGRLDFSGNGLPERIALSMNEKKTTVILLPLGNQRFALMLQARDWTSPKFPQTRLDDFQVAGVLGVKDFVAHKFSLRLRGITLKGSAKVGFGDGWQAEATMNQIDAQLDQVVPAKQVELSGVLSANGVLSAKAATLGALKDNFHFSGGVHIRQASAYIPESLRVDVHPKYMQLDALEARLYGGKLSGTLNLNHGVISAKIAVNGIALQPLVKSFSEELLFSGSLEGAATMRLETQGKFPENMQFNGDFHCSNGRLEKVDLLQAASGKTSASGEATRFDDLTGLLAVDETGYHFRKLKLQSGALNAEGRVDVSPALQLAGTLDTEVKGTAGLISLPVVVSGSLRAPVVAPSGSAMAGAAVGTAILGPGLGTVVGIRVGGFLHKLFGKDDNTSANRERAPKPPLRK